MTKVKCPICLKKVRNLIAHAKVKHPKVYVGVDPAKPGSDVTVRTTVRAGLLGLEVLGPDTLDLAPTTTGEQEDARRWRGAAVLCDACGEVIEGLIALHCCRGRSKEKR